MEYGSKLSPNKRKQACALQKDPSANLGLFFGLQKVSIPGRVHLVAESAGFG